METATNVDLKDIKVMCKLGGTIDDVELFNGLVFPNKGPLKGNFPQKVENPKVAML